jgi:hypothetical protein
MRDLREGLKARLFDYAGQGPFLCDLCWQGDFGKGISTGSGVWSDAGANPCLLSGPVPSATATDQAVGIPQWRLGMVINGDLGSEFVFGKLTLGATTDLLPGQFYELDKDFNATLLTTGNSVLNDELVVLNVWALQQAAGTYYGWFQRAGHCAVQAAAASVANGQAETTATGGVMKFLASANHTAGTKSTQNATAYGASSSITFTGNTTIGSPYITNVVSGNANGGIADLQLGQVITGAGFPANAIIAAIDKVGGQWRITIGTNTAGSYGVPQNCTATAAGVAGTVTNMVVANLYWANLLTQN